MKKLGAGKGAGLFLFGGKPPGELSS